MGKLTAKFIESLTEPGTYEDGDGLHLVVSSTGRKNWVLRFQTQGKRREMGLAGYPRLDLKKAQAAAYENRSQLLKGEDLLARRQAEQAAKKDADQREQVKQITFEMLTNDYRDAHGSSWSENWREGWHRKLELYTCPHLGKLSSDDDRNQTGPRNPAADLVDENTHGR